MLLTVAEVSELSHLVELEHLKIPPNISGLHIIKATNHYCKGLERVSQILGAEMIKSAVSIACRNENIGRQGNDERRIEEAVQRH